MYLQCFEDANVQGDLKSTVKSHKLLLEWIDFFLNVLKATTLFPQDNPYM